MDCVFTVMVIVDGMSMKQGTAVLTSDLKGAFNAVLPTKIIEIILEVFYI